MMIPTRDEFEYFARHNCQCLQLRDIPDTMDVYYRHDYYSFSAPPLAYIPQKTTPNPERILDVGCGNGQWLCSLPAQGYIHLYGCDPYIEKDLFYDNGVIIKKSTIHEMEGCFDFIQFSHSFEHMPDPLDVMKSIRRLLAPEGICHISIPVFPNIAFAIYGPFWYQIDAPRHHFLHSKESIGYLAGLAGLSVLDVKYYSNNSQFIRSRLYQLDIPFHEQTPEAAYTIFTPQDIERMDLMAQQANEQQMGDMATFTLRLQM